MSNLDDMHENGIHDYMKFVKFVMGIPITSKDIRAGKLNRSSNFRSKKRDQ